MCNWYQHHHFTIKTGHEKPSTKSRAANLPQGITWDYLMIHNLRCFTNYWAGFLVRLVTFLSFNPRLRSIMLFYDCITGLNSRWNQTIDFQSLACLECPFPSCMPGPNFQCTCLLTSTQGLISNGLWEMWFPRLRRVILERQPKGLWSSVMSFLFPCYKTTWQWQCCFW